MDRDLTEKQNTDLETLRQVEDIPSFVEVKRLAVKEGIKVLFKKNGIKA